ncbi:hypothetical protein [Chryseobacterium potabilaquae]|uniref:Uncharacterized protein n=1 Tax=Chryseobacterium potabilaquae TaxID=2675057 RepID=A0A6N4X848_9FLAO|nr:hypothetical protein [Chryseobacterium potabilaquae]CAA7197190.1 hypothetical protein CHRY9293_03244 [Chryseobacterium potabilaquae]
MIRNVFEMIFKRNEDSAKMNIWSLFLLSSFAVFSVLVYASYTSKPSLNSLMIYIIALVAYLSFGLVFISSLAGSIGTSSWKKRSDRHL